MNMYALIVVVASMVLDITGIILNLGMVAARKAEREEVFAYICMYIGLFILLACQMLNIFTNVTLNILNFSSIIIIFISLILSVIDLIKRWKH